MSHRGSVGPGLDGPTHEKDEKKRKHYSLVARYGQPATTTHSRYMETLFHPQKGWFLYKYSHFTRVSADATRVEREGTRNNRIGSSESLHRWLRDSELPTGANLNLRREDRVVAGRTLQQKHLNCTDFSENFCDVFHKCRVNSSADLLLLLGVPS